jgi:hypothetical protein
MMNESELSSSAINHRSGIIKGYGDELLKKFLLNLKAFDWIVASHRTIKKFAFNY